jgi:hypothetical protein
MKIYLDNTNDNGMDETQSIILERIQKAISGLSIREAKDVLYTALNHIDDVAILNYPSSKT